MPQPESQDNQAGDARLSMQTSMSFCERPTNSLTASTPNQINNGSAMTQEPSPQPSGTPTEPAQGRCRHFPDTCKFPTYSIILSPCIADFPWVADDLLSSHGVAECLRDPKEWLTPGTQPPGTPSSSTASNSSRRIKIALVDTRRKEATVAFLQSIEAAGLKRRNGEREYVPIYDWRVLETIREEERKHACNKWKLGTRFDLSGQGSVWRRFWVGLA
jgi:DNA ligase-4